MQFFWATLYVTGNTEPSLNKPTTKMQLTMTADITFVTTISNCC